MAAPPSGVSTTPSSIVYQQTLYPFIQVFDEDAEQDQAKYRQAYLVVEQISNSENQIAKWHKYSNFFEIKNNM